MIKYDSTRGQDSSAVTCLDVLSLVGEPVGTGGGVVHPSPLSCINTKKFFKLSHRTGEGNKVVLELTFLTLKHYIFPELTICTQTTDVLLPLKSTY